MDARLILVLAVVLGLICCMCVGSITILASQAAAIPEGGAGLHILLVAITAASGLATTALGTLVGLCIPSRAQPTPASHPFIQASAGTGVSTKPNGPG